MGLRNSASSLTNQPHIVLSTLHHSCCVSDLDLEGVTSPFPATLVHQPVLCCFCWCDPSRSGGLHPDCYVWSPVRCPRSASRYSLASTDVSLFCLATAVSFPLHTHRPCPMSSEAAAPHLVASPSPLPVDGVSPHLLRLQSILLALLEQWLIRARVRCLNRQLLVSMFLFVSLSLRRE